MDYLSQILADPRLERTVTIKTKPTKDGGQPEAPLSPDSANLPPAVLQMLGLQSAQPEGPPTNEMLAALLGQGGGMPMPMPTPDPLGGQIPIDIPTANPYGA